MGRASLAESVARWALATSLGCVAGILGGVALLLPMAALHPALGAAWIGAALGGCRPCHSPSGIVMYFLAMAGATYEERWPRAMPSATPPPGWLVAVGGYRLHLHCGGEGASTVVLSAGRLALASPSAGSECGGEGREAQRAELAVDLLGRAAVRLLHPPA
jgi:hypothetical protein